MINNQYSNALETKESGKGLLVPYTKAYFERFYDLKKQINNKYLKALDYYSARNHPKNALVYNIYKHNNDKLKLFVGEAATIFLAGKELAFYIGGFCGTKYNFTCAKF